jgi:hypothetical protein
MILFLRGHVRSSFENNILYCLLKKIKLLIPDIKIYIQTWNVIQSNVSWRKMNLIDRSVTNEMIYDYFRDLKSDIKNIVILDDTKIDLIGDLSGNICCTKSPKRGWKNMWYGIYEGLRNINENENKNETVINTRFDILTNSVELNDVFVLNFIKKNMNFIKKNINCYENRLIIISQTACIGIDNLFIGNCMNMYEFVKYFYFNLDEIFEKYPLVFNQEFIFYYENNSYHYNKMVTKLQEMLIEKSKIPIKTNTMQSVKMNFEKPINAEISKPLKNNRKNFEKMSFQSSKDIWSNFL